MSQSKRKPSEECGGNEEYDTAAQRRSEEDQRNRAIAKGRTYERLIANGVDPEYACLEAGRNPYGIDLFANWY